jgi:hypothetical protein
MENRIVNLTEDERRMVTRLRLKEATWRYSGKWMMLIVGVLAGCRSIWELTNPQRDGFWPIMLMGFLAAWFIVQAAKHWRGNPERSLLLKLVDCCSQENSPAV